MKNWFKINQLIQSTYPHINSMKKRKLKTKNAKKKNQPNHMVMSVGKEKAFEKLASVPDKNFQKAISL
jgi:hypothetical protein